jgi:hypothetical protein
MRFQVLALFAALRCVRYFSFHLRGEDTAGAELQEASHHFNGIVKSHQLRSVGRVARGVRRTEPNRTAPATGQLQPAVVVLLRECITRVAYCFLGR